MCFHQVLSNLGTCHRSSALTRERRKGAGAGVVKSGRVFLWTALRKNQGTDGVASGSIAAQGQKRRTA